MYRDWVNLILKLEYLLPRIRLKDKSRCNLVRVVFDLMANDHENTPNKLKVPKWYMDQELY